MTENFQVTGGIRYTSEKRASDLTVTQADTPAIADRHNRHAPRPPTAYLPSAPGAGGFHPCLTCSWAQDPVQVVQDLFPDANGDGIPDFTLSNTSSMQEEEETFTKITPMASISYNLPDHWLEDTFLDSTMVYATWSTGFKSGFFEPRGADGLQELDPEELENREVGVKMEAFDSSLRFNVALYSMELREHAVDPGDHRLPGQPDARFPQTLRNRPSRV
ncbi:MAG: TonB-dependent receptor [Halioglobus sp.]|nr:TonB-dependent receptor [Halioglobus sp.]